MRVRRAALTLLSTSMLLAGGSAAHAAPPPVSDPTKTWTEKFADDFNGPVLDTTKWTRCYWWSSGGCTNSGNNELQWYSPGNVVIENGLAKLRAKKETVLRQGGKIFRYTSGMITTGRDSGLLGALPRFQFKYGYMEMRAKVPWGKGLWPAFWALPSSHSWPPEIDAMEIRGQEPATVAMAVHYRDATGSYRHLGTGWSGPDFTQDFHTFAVHWRPDALVWYVDDVPRYTVTDPLAIPHEPMYLLANLAVGGTFAGSPDATTPFPSDLQVDYVRVWQEEPPRVATLRARTRALCRLRLRQRKAGRRVAIPRSCRRLRR